MWAEWNPIIVGPCSLLLLLFNVSLLITFSCLPSSHSFPLSWPLPLSCSLIVCFSVSLLVTVVVFSLFTLQAFSVWLGVAFWHRMCVTGSVQPKAGSKGIPRVKGTDVQYYLPGGPVPPTPHASGACSLLISVRPEGQNRIFPGVMSSSLLLTIKTLFGFPESTLFPLPHWPAFPLFISSFFFFFLLHIFDRF